jgi:phosphatidylserine decarboxylase
MTIVNIRLEKRNTSPTESHTIETHRLQNRNGRMSWKHMRPAVQDDEPRTMTAQTSSSNAPASLLARVFLQEDLNFLVTNRLPRRYATLAMGRFSRIESRTLTKLSIALWQLFAGDLHLEEAKTSNFHSLQECFTRELRPGTRPIHPDPRVIVSPCDALVGAHGRIQDTTLFQAKGFPYKLEDLLGDRELVERHRDGYFATLRLTSSMYHRFHAPTDGRIRNVTYVSGDTWNVNPIALRRVEELFCKNERAILDIELPDPEIALTLVPVAAIMVASIKLHFLDELLDLRYRGKNRIACDATFEKGQQLGYFQSGSTIIVFASGPFEFAPGVAQDRLIRVGEPLLCRIDSPNRRFVDTDQRKET